MSRLGTLSEIDKLAVTLARTPAELAFLQTIPPEDLRSLRVSVYERLFELDAPAFERLAAIAMRLPARIAAALAERALGPLVTARVVAELPAGDALPISELVSVSFFADVCAYLDPRRTRDMIAALPVGRLVEVALELVRREEFMTISRFIDFLSDEHTQAAIDTIEDEAAILQIAFYMGSKNRTDHLFRLLGRARIERLVERVQSDADRLLPAFLSVVIHVSYALKRELAEIVAAQPPPVLTGYIRATQDGELWPDVLPVVAAMSDRAQRAVVNLPILADREVQRAIILTAEAHGQWGELLLLIREMDGANRDAVAAIIASIGGHALAHAVDAALLGERWDVLIDLAERMPEAKRAELSTIVAQTIGPHDPELLARIEAQESSAAEASARASSEYS